MNSEDFRLLRKSVQEAYDMTGEMKSMAELEFRKVDEAFRKVDEAFKIADLRLSDMEKSAKRMRRRISDLESEAESTKRRITYPEEARRRISDLESEAGEARRRISRMEGILEMRGAGGAGEAAGGMPEADRDGAGPGQNRGRA